MVGLGQARSQGRTEKGNLESVFKLHMVVIMLMGKTVGGDLRVQGFSRQRRKAR